MNEISPQEYFKRQITLSEFGQEAQQKLQNTKVIVVGCGGLGSAIAVHLATSGIGKIHLVDFDTISVSNLHRQVFFSSGDIDQSKAQILAQIIEKKAPFTKVTFSNKPITKATVFEFLENVDIVVDGTDSLPTKYLLNDACVHKSKPLIYGSLYKFDGYVASFNVLQNDKTYSANLRDAFPVMEQNLPNCEEAGTLNPIVGMIAMLQVNEVIKLASGLGEPLINQLLIYNSLENTQFKMKLKHSFSSEVIKELFDKETYYDASCQIQEKDWLITQEMLLQAQENMPNSIEVISVIENPPKDYPFKVDKWIALSKLKDQSIEIEDSKMYVLICNKGVSSYQATVLLRSQYPEKAIFSLVGGVDLKK